MRSSGRFKFNSSGVQRFAPAKVRLLLMQIVSWTIENKTACCRTQTTTGGDLYDKRTTKKKTAELPREMTCAPRAHYAEQSHSQFTSREESNRIANCLQIVVSYYNLVSQENFNPRSPWGERQQRCTVLGAHLWRRYIIFAHFREIGLSAWAASGESGGKQRSKSRANLPGIFCLPGLRNQRIRGASGI